MNKNTPMETLLRYVAMAENFKSFEVDPRSCSELADAIKWIISDRANQINRCALLRQRPDLPVERIQAFEELERLQRLEQESLSPDRDAEHYGLSVGQVKEWAEQNGGLMSRAEFAALCQLALERMDTFKDQRGVVWTSPTPYAYAAVCHALRKAEGNLKSQSGERE